MIDHPLSHTLDVEGFDVYAWAGTQEPLACSSLSSKAAAANKEGYLMGGASTADQALPGGLVDGLNLKRVPSRLGSGTRLFAGLDTTTLQRT